MRGTPFSGCIPLNLRETSTNTQDERTYSRMKVVVEADLEGLLPAALEPIQDKGGHGDARLHATLGFLWFFWEAQGFEFAREAPLTIA